MKAVLAAGITILSLASAGAVGTLVYTWTAAPDLPETPAVATKLDRPAEPERPASKSSSGTPAVTAAVEALKALAPAAPQADRAPAFDVARIQPDGEAVIAGRAAPGAAVELLRGGEVHDRAVANRSGEFVFIPKTLPPGNYDLTLRATQPDGKVSTSKDSVAVVVLRSGTADKPAVTRAAPDKPAVAPAIAARPRSEDKPVVALAAPEKPAAVPPKPATDTTATLTIGVVEAEAGGKLYVSGQSAPGASVRLYLNDAYIATATASTEGRLAFAIQSGVKPGDYRVRLDQVDAAGSVRSRAEVSFKAPVTVAAPAPPAPAPQAVAAASASPSPATAPTPPAAPPASAAAPASPPALASASTRPAPAPAVPAPVTSAAESRPPPAPSESSPRVAAVPPVLPEAAAQPATPAPRVANAPAAPPPSLLPAAPEPAPRQPPALAGVTSPPAAKPEDRKDVVVVPSVDTAVVARGDSLWRISQSTYGQGLRYPVIYTANRDQIRDPDLIYPGQIFVLPKPLPAAPR